MVCRAGEVTGGVDPPPPPPPLHLPHPLSLCWIWRRRRRRRVESGGGKSDDTEGGVVHGTIAGSQYQALTFFFCFLVDFHMHATPPLLSLITIDAMIEAGVTNNAFYHLR